MFRFGQNTDPQKQFIVNKGNIKMVSEGDFKIAYDQSLSGHIAVATAADTIRIDVSKDIPNASIYLNSGNMPNCTVTVGSGILEVQDPCPNSVYKVASGTLDAKLAKGKMGSVKAKVNVGILSNSSDLTEIRAEAEDMHLGHNPFAGAGISSSLELMGEEQGSASFEVGAGTINLHE
jgi:hypothetical protein